MSIFIFPFAMIELPSIRLRATENYSRFIGNSLSEQCVSQRVHTSCNIYGRKDFSGKTPTVPTPYTNLPTVGSRQSQHPATHTPYWIANDIACQIIMLPTPGDATRTHAVLNQLLFMTAYQIVYLF